MFVLFALLSLPLGTDDPGRQPDEATVQRHVAAARRGDREALRLLYRWHAARVMRTVRALCRSDADAEDVTQETFARAFAALDRYEPKAGARFVSWLLTIARNTALRLAKKQARAIATEPETLAELAGSDEPAAVELAGLRRALLEALSGLDERDRWVVCLRWGGELEAAEVAEITGLSAAHVRKICERQRKQLLEKLARRGFTEARLEETA